ncbi:MAG: YHS domain-containing protein [Desulfurococcaceae archaeon]
MRVGPSNSKYKTIYKGKVYYFCSLHCLGEFEKNPEFYLHEGRGRCLLSMVWY